MEKDKNDKLTKKIAKDNNLIFNIVVVICIALFAIAVAPKSLQNDTFYTIKIGEFIMQNGISNLTEDNFSWHELPYTFPHWLYDLCVYIVYNSFGQKRNLLFNNNFYCITRWCDLFVK